MDCSWIHPTGYNTIRTLQLKTRPSMDSPTTWLHELSAHLRWKYQPEPSTGKLRSGSSKSLSQVSTLHVFDALLHGVQELTFSGCSSGVVSASRLHCVSSCAAIQNHHQRRDSKNNSLIRICSHSKQVAHNKIVPSVTRYDSHFASLVSYNVDSDTIN